MELLLDIILENRTDNEGERVEPELMSFYGYDAGYIHSCYFNSGIIYPTEEVDDFFKPKRPLNFATNSTSWDEQAIRNFLAVLPEVFLLF